MKTEYHLITRLQDIITICIICSFCLFFSCIFSSKRFLSSARDAVRKGGDFGGGNFCFDKYGTNGGFFHSWFILKAEKYIYYLLM